MPDVERHFFLIGDLFLFTTAVVLERVNSVTRPIDLQRPQCAVKHDAVLNPASEWHRVPHAVAEAEVVVVKFPHHVDRVGCSCVVLLDELVADR
ncbi:hypothetical protein D3C83_97610 [compost metagenome]